MPDTANVVKKQEVPSTIPQQSMRTFVPPSTTPVKKPLSVKEFMEDIHTPTVKEVLPEIAPQKNISPTTQGNREIGNREIGNKETGNKEIENIGNGEQGTRNEEQKIENTEPRTTNPESRTPNLEINNQELFLKCWKEVIDLNFQKQPTVYFTLKEYQPEIVNNIIYLTVKNELQKEEIEEKKRILIAYLRNNYKNEIEDIEILVNEEMESKVKLLDERDKLKLLHEQNNSLSDFMKILNLNLKE